MYLGTTLKLLPLALLLLACGPRPETTAPTGPTVLSSSDVIIAQQGEISVGPRVSGDLQAAQQAVLRAELGGSVSEVAVEVGEVVAKGQVLGRIDNAAARSAVGSASAGVVSAQAGVDNATRELARVTELVRVGALATRDQEMAQSALLAAQAQLMAARSQAAAAGDQADATTIRAPMAGVVSQRSVSAGDVVAPGTPMFTIIEPGSLRLEASVPADALASAKVGARVRFTVQGMGAQTYDGEVTRVAPAVDPVTRQIPVLVSVPNPEGALVAGLFAEGRLASEVRTAVVVPRAALSESGATTTVLKVVDGRAAETPVQVGLRDDDKETVEITSGVSAGDVLLLSGAAAPGEAVTLPKAG